VPTIIGLSKIGENFDPTIVSEENSFGFETKKATYGIYLTEHCISDTNEVSDQEHITFLTFWLSNFVFCTSSLQVDKSFIGMTIQLHEGCKFCLGKLNLGSLYESVGYGDQLMQYLAKGKSLVLSGPLWLFQL